jgi:hypothetical protein
MRAVIFGSLTVLLLLATPAPGQTFNCGASLPPIYASTPDATTQINSNFQALERAVACLQNALAASQVDLRDAEQRLLDLQRQTGIQPYGVSGTERVTVRACASGDDVVYLPMRLACESVGPGYQDEQALRPTYEVIVPR